MVDTKQVLQDLIDGLNQQIVETEGIIQAQQGCCIALKRTRNDIVAKKRGIEEDEKREKEQVAKESGQRKKKTRKSGQTKLN